MVQFRNEYVQYKAECERLQAAVRVAEEHLAAQVRAMNDKDRDMGDKLHEIESHNNDLQQ
jgi:hypothetical protein